MALQTSRMYGVKVKEKVNYYEFGDAGSGNQITLSYENKVWTVKAGGNAAPAGDVSWFMNGVEYQKGDTIVTFNDGDKVSYTIMEQDRSVTPYINLMYDVYGNSAGNSKYGTSDIVYKVASGDINIYPTYTCKVYKMENGIITNEKSFTNKDINNHKQMYEQGITNSPLYTVFKNIAFDWNEETLMFTAISNSNYIKYNNNTYSKNETIRSFRTTVFEGFEIVDETNKHEVVKVDSNALPTVMLIKRRGGLTMMSAQKDHDTICSNVMHDHKDAYYNGYYHDAMFLVYDNPTADGCWKKKLKSIAVTYADPYWFLMTTAAGIEYGGHTYESRKLIRTWKPETPVNITLKQNISRKKPIPDNENYDRFVYNVVEEDGQDTVFVYYYQIVATEDEEGIHDEYVLVDSVGFTSSDTQEHNPINWKNIKFKLENNVWTIMTRNSYITYEGRELKSNKPIKSFNVRGAINIEIGDNSDKKGAAADKFVYDVEESEGQDSITVKFQQVVNQKDAQGHNHKSYIDIETTTFSSSDAVVTFRNIQFKVKNNLWTIYSKCGYIKFNGRMYPNNRSILSFSVSEAIHIEIADESNIYEVKEQRIYNIKTPNSEVTVGYSVITSETTRALKLIKMSGDKEEPWVTVNFYEAMYKSYVYDDISVRYDAKETKWELYSNSDDLYLNGTNYKLGSKIGESWSYYTFANITGITVIHANSEALEMSVQIIKDGKVVNNVDIDEDIGWYDSEDLDFHLGYSYTKGLWVFRAIHNCWVEGINYTTGSVIKSFKTRLNVDQFTMMFRHYDDEEHPDIPTNVLYYITTIVDPFSGVTTVNVNCPGYGSNSYSDKDTSKEADKSYTFTTQDAKSMYGYIWRRFDGPVPPPTDKSLYIVVALYKSSVGSAITSIYSNSVPLEITVNNKFSQSEPGVINTGHFNKVTINGTTYVFWSRTSGSSPTYVVGNYGAWANRVVYYMNDTQVSISYCVLLQNGDIVYQYDSTSSETIKGKYTVSYIHDVCRITITDPVVILEQSFAWLSLWTTFIVTNDGFVSIDFDGGWKNSRLTGFKYHEGTISQINNNIEALNAINAELSGSGCSVLADHFEGNTAIRFGSSIVSNCRIGKTPQTFADLDMSYYGQVIMKYDFGSNSISYYNRYSTKQLYEKVYSANDKKYLWTDGPTWTYIASTSPVTIDIGGDLKYYLYEMESVDDYLDLPAPISTQERTVNRSGLIPSIVNPTIDINRIDSDTPFKISPLSSFDILDNIPIKQGPIYSDYTDKVIIHQNGIVAVLDTVSFSQAANNFAWSLDNYGINNDYN